MDAERTEDKGTMIQRVPNRPQDDRQTDIRRWKGKDIRAEQTVHRRHRQISLRETIADPNKKKQRLRNNSERQSPKGARTRYQRTDSRWLSKEHLFTKEQKTMIATFVMT